MCHSSEVYCMYISSRVNAVKCEMSVFLITVALCSVVEFDQLGILLCLTRGRGEERGEERGGLCPLSMRGGGGTLSMRGGEGGGSLPFEYEGEGSLP